MAAARFWFSQRRKPAEPFAFVSYGMTRCGSTLAFQLARVALCQAGYDQPLVPFPNRAPRRKINFVGGVNDNHARILRDFVAELGHPVAIKTHNRPDLALVRMIEDGSARAHAVFRDPRDMALSLLDSGRKARAQGKPAFAEMATLEDAKRGIDNQLDSLSAWLQLPGVARMPYPRLAEETEAAAEDVLEQLGIDGTPKRIVAQVLNREFTQRNRAVPARHEAEMAEADNDDFQRRYAPFFELVLNRPDATAPLPPGTVLHAAPDERLTATSNG